MTNADAVTHLIDLDSCSNFKVCRSLISRSYLVNAFVDENGDIVEKSGRRRSIVIVELVPDELAGE